MSRKELVRFCIVNKINLQKYLVDNRTKLSRIIKDDDILVKLMEFKLNEKQVHGVST